MRNCRTATRPSRACCASICRRASPPRRWRGLRGLHAPPSRHAAAAEPGQSGARGPRVRRGGPDPVRGRAAGIVARRASSGFRVRRAVCRRGLSGGQGRTGASVGPARARLHRLQAARRWLGGALAWPAATSASRCSPRAVSLSTRPAWRAAGGAGRRRALGGDQEPYVRAGLLRRILPQWRGAVARPCADRRQLPARVRALAGIWRGAWIEPGAALHADAARHQHAQRQQDEQVRFDHDPAPGAADLGLGRHEARLLARLLLPAQEAERGRIEQSPITTKA